MLHKLSRRRIHWDGLVVLTKPFGCSSALEKGNCWWIDHENRQNTIHDEILQSLSNALWRVARLSVDNRKRVLWNVWNKI